MPNNSEMTPSQVCEALNEAIDRIDKECSHIADIDPLIVLIATTLATLEVAHIPSDLPADFDVTARRIFFEITGRDIRLNLTG